MREALFLVVLAVLCFLLQGEPSLWDQLHARAMEVSAPAAGKAAP